MYIRGSGSGNEYKRTDLGFYKGIVVKNNDPLGLNRVKVFIPELTNQPHDSWLEVYTNIHINGIGSNTKNNWSSVEENGDFSNTKILKEIIPLIPWAEQCSPIIGESGSFRFYKDGKLAVISDCNYPEGFEVNDDSPPTLENGSYSPAFLYENFGTRLGDAFTKPLENYTSKCNPYSFSYAPSKHVNKHKGIIGIPEIGSKVWVFHYEGDHNFPVYFGNYNSFRELAPVKELKDGNTQGIKYPIAFENT